MISIKYLGFIIEIGKGVCINLEKIKIIKKWEVFITVKDIRSFFDFVNFY